MARKRQVVLVMYVDIDETADLEEETRNLMQFADNYGVDEMVNTLNCVEFYLSDTLDPILGINAWSDKFMC